jgi:hypothetical protein
VKLTRAFRAKRRGVRRCQMGQRTDWAVGRALIWLDTRHNDAFSPGRGPVQSFKITLEPGMRLNTHYRSLQSVDHRGKSIAKQCRLKRPGRTTGPANQNLLRLLIPPPPFLPRPIQVALSQELELNSHSTGMCPECCPGYPSYLKLRCTVVRHQCRKEQDTLRFTRYCRKM